ncbi:MAG: hypothetical protein WCI05_13530 [Myxococcales bacterium]
MSEIWVVNASPLIVLAKVGRLDLLCDAGREIVVPGAVAREVLAGPNDAAGAAVRGLLASRVVDHVDLPSVLEWGLGAGATLGTLGGVILARAEGRIASAAEVLRRVRGPCSVSGSPPPVT